MATTDKVVVNFFKYYLLLCLLLFFVPALDCFYHEFCISLHNFAPVLIIITLLYINTVVIFFYFTYNTDKIH